MVPYLSYFIVLYLLIAESSPLFYLSFIFLNDQYWSGISMKFNENGIHELYYVARNILK